MVQEVKEVSPPGQAYRCFGRQRQWCGDVVQGTLRSTFGKPRETGRRKATELRRLGGRTRLGCYVRRAAKFFANSGKPEDAKLIGG